MIFIVAAKYPSMECRHERRTLAAERDIRSAKIRDNPNAGSNSNRRRIPELYRVWRTRVGCMQNCLAVTADGRDSLGWVTGRIEQVECRVREYAAEFDM